MIRSQFRTPSARSWLGVNEFNVPAMSTIDGQLFSAWMPKHLWHELPWPPYGAAEAEVLAYEQAYNERGRWRFQLHAGPAADGATRWKCPFHAGLLRSRQLPFTMRRSRNVPLVELPAGAKCCDGIISVSAADLPSARSSRPAPRPGASHTGAATWSRA